MWFSLAPFTAEDTQVSLKIYLPKVMRSDYSVWNLRCYLELEKGHSWSVCFGGRGFRVSKVRYMKPHEVMIQVSYFEIPLNPPPPNCKNSHKHYTIPGEVKIIYLVWLNDIVHI